MSTTYRALVAALIMGGVHSAASATVFDFSYSFASSSHMVNGSISGNRNDNGTAGDLSDDFVEGIAVLSAFYDGVAFDGPLTLSAYDHLGFVGGPSTMAFAVDANHLIIANCDDVPSCTAGYADASFNINYFMLRTPGQGGAAAAFYSEAGTDVHEDPARAAGWSLAEHAVTAVPEPGTYVLLGLGLATLALARRRRRS